MSAQLFTWLQGAPFYASVHAEALDLVPSKGRGRRWLDVGCGPGLVTRLAAARGYSALGADRSGAMVTAAKRIATDENSRARFEQTDVAALVAAGRTADVVSAASLLAVVDDPKAVLQDLWSLVAPGGALLIIEPTPAMTVANACSLVGRGLPRGRRLGLLVWARARQGRSVAAHVEAFAPNDLRERVDRRLLDGLVGAWCLQRAGSSDTSKGQ